MVGYFIKNNNKRIEFDICRHTNLDYLDIKSIHIPENDIIECLYMCDNVLTNLDTTNCKNLKILECQNNNIQTIKFNSNIKEVYCFNNKIKSIDISNLFRIIRMHTDITTNICGYNEKLHKYSSILQQVND